MGIESMKRRMRLRALGRSPGSTWALALVVALAANGVSEKAGAGAVVWPASREGQVAKGWVEAFDAGEPAMRRFLAENLAASSLAAKGVDDRIVTYRSLREKLGSLALVRVVEERPGALDVGLADAKGTEHEFTFELESVETGEPRKLRSITGRLTEQHSMFPH